MCNFENIRYVFAFDANLSIDRPGAQVALLDESAECRGMLRTVLMGKDGKDSIRVTTTLTRVQHNAVERIASQNHVKVAWVIRQAVERLIEQAEGGPLLPLDWK